MDRQTFYWVRCATKPYFFCSATSSKPIISTSRAGSTDPANPRRVLAKTGFQSRKSACGFHKNLIPGSIFPQVFMRLMELRLARSTVPLEVGDAFFPTWDVIADNPGPADISLTVESPQGEGANFQYHAEFRSAPPLSPNLDYVPIPHPIHTSIDILTYYMPGWPSRPHWMPSRYSAPYQRPMLGWYDETNTRSGRLANQMGRGKRNYMPSAGLVFRAGRTMVQPLA